MMNLDGFPNPNSPDGMLMFGGGGALWPGPEADKFRPFNTLGSVESNWDLNTQYNLNFTTNSYGLDDMGPSPASQARKKKVQAKEVVGYRGRRRILTGRQNYTDEETMLLTRCWVELSTGPGWASPAQVRRGPRVLRPSSA